MHQKMRTLIKSKCVTSAQCLCVCVFQMLPIFPHRFSLKWKFNQFSPYPESFYSISIDLFYYAISLIDVRHPNHGFLPYVNFALMPITKAIDVDVTCNQASKKLFQPSPILLLTKNGFSFPQRIANKPGKSISNFLPSPCIGNRP